MRRRPQGPDLAGLRSRRARIAPRLEPLEARLVLAAFVVTDPGDSGPNTLRDAIEQANAAAGVDTITFNLGAGIQTITPLSPLPAITDVVVLDGSNGVSSPTAPQVEIDGSGAGETADGLVFAQGTQGTSSSSASGSAVRNLAVNRFGGSGLVLNGAGNISIQSSYLGVNAKSVDGGAPGTVARPNGRGLAILGSGGNTIGGSAAGAGNVISGNTGAGVAISGSLSVGNTILGNRIGIDAAGGTAVPNADGVVIGGGIAGATPAANNTIGATLLGTATGGRNIISGNTGAGVRITGSGATGNVVEGNFIGTNLAGNAAVGNGVGVAIQNGAASNTVGGTSTTAQNVISGNATVGVLIDGSNTNVVQANRIGSNAEANGPLPGTTQATAGVFIQNGASNNSIGGSGSTLGNVISGNAGAGVIVEGRAGTTGNVGSGNQIQGNTIGGNALGGAVLANGQQGVVVRGGATGTGIGGTTGLSRNLIVGSGAAGILLSGGSTGTTVQANSIGVSTDGSTALANGAEGIRIDGSSNNSIGGTLAAAGNTIAFNGGAGVNVVDGTGNAIRRNSIFNNGALGIDLAPTGVNTNDALDADGGANLGQNVPVLSSAQTSGSVTTVAGRIDSAPNTTYIIELFSVVDTDPSFTGEGRTFVGTTTVRTDANGSATFSATTTSQVAINSFISATATDPNGNTSEFSGVALNLAPTADLGVTLTASPSPVASGGVLTYTLTVTNAGPSNSTGATTTLTLPAGATFIGGSAPQGTFTTSTTGTGTGAVTTVTVNLGTLLPNAPVAITVNASPTVVPAAGTATATATVSQDTTIADANQANNTATLDSPVVQGVDLGVFGVVTPSASTPNAPLSFTFTVTNASTIQATGVSLVSLLPAGLTFVSASSSQGTVTQSGGVVRADLGTIPVNSTTVGGASAVVTIIVVPASTGQASLSAVISANQPDPNTPNNATTSTAIINTAATPTTQDGPRVADVVRTGQGRQATRLVLTFDSALESNRAEDRSNYRLVAANRNGRFGTGSRRIAIRSAVYDETNNTVTLTAAQRYGLGLLTRLIVNGSSQTGVTGSNGLLLDGDADGQPGGNFVTQVRGFGQVAVAQAAVPAGPRGRKS